MDDPNIKPDTMPSPETTATPVEATPDVHPGEVSPVTEAPITPVATEASLPDRPKLEVVEEISQTPSVMDTMKAPAGSPIVAEADQQVETLGIDTGKPLVPDNMVPVSNVDVPVVPAEPINDPMKMSMAGTEKLPGWNSNSPAESKVEDPVLNTSTELPKWDTPPVVAETPAPVAIAPLVDSSLPPAPVAEAASTDVAKPAEVMPLVTEKPAAPAKTGFRWPWQK